MHSIEAAVIVPIILFLFCGSLYLGFHLHDGVKEAAEWKDRWNISIMKEVRTIDVMMEGKEVLYDN
ncbi:MAG: hypothetical protein IJ567_09070 [Lachnospiraceae bacterium]|nr:hypothetical protein [Lachnospiraceae bacterium]